MAENLGLAYCRKRSNGAKLAVEGGTDPAVFCRTQKYAFEPKQDILIRSKCCHLTLC